MEQKKIAGLNALLEEAILNKTFPGVNYVLVVKEKTYFASLGKKALFPEEEENNIDTLYDMASCTKVLATTSCIMKLIEQGRLRLYDSVKSYLPNFIHDNITIWDLLTHSSGLPADVVGGSMTPTKGELIDKIMNVELKYQKNTQIFYSDIGFILLGMVVEEISKMPLDHFATKYIFGPLEMVDTGFNPQDINRCAPTEDRQDRLYKGIVRGFVHDEKAHTFGGVAGQAGLFSTVKDIEHFIRMVLDNGIYKGKQIFSKATIDTLFKAQVESTNGISLDKERRGLGWIIKGNNTSAGDLCSEETISHTGFTGTNIFIDRINQIGFSMLTNRVHPTRQNGLLFPFRGKVANYIISNFGGRK